MSYFGILSKKDFENELTQNLPDLGELDDYQIEIENKITFKIRESEIKYLLFEKGIFEIDYLSESLNIIDYNKPEDFPNLTFDDFEGNISAPWLLSLKTYNIIWEIFKHNVIEIKLNFFKDFRKITYGLNYEDKKKIALSEFCKIYESMNIREVERPFEIETYEKKITFTPSYLFHLFRHRQTIINKFKNHIYLPYLYGDLKLYKLSDYQNPDKFQELLSFQIKLEILLELNNEFNFEKDIYFNNIFYYRLSVIVYSTLFKDTDPLVFCLQKLFYNEPIKITEIESMYSFLNGRFFIGKKTDFINIINENFKTNFTKIRDYDTNLNHNFRVENIEIEWGKFQEKYC